MTDNELLELIRQDRANGLSYQKIMIKHNLKSNNLIKVALGKTTGSDKKYRGRYEQRYRELKVIKKKYDALVALISKFVSNVKEVIDNEDY